MMRRAALGLAIAVASVLGTGAAAQSQSETLADIRAGLAALYGEVQALSEHLKASGGGAVSVSGSSALERLSAIERELQRLTARSEELEFRIDRIVRDGTGRIAGLERRLCALEPACDPADLVGQPVLGGVAPVPAAPMILAPSGPQLAVDERAAFDRARAAYDAGDYLTAAEGFAAHLATWPGGPLSTEAELLRGRALGESGDIKNAARAFLAAFSADKDGPLAAEALTALGQALAELGQTVEACATLAEVSTRFDGAPAAIAAAAARAKLECP